VDLVLVADFGVDARRLLGVDLPAQADVHGHPHLLARERRDLLDLITRKRVLLLARRVALDRGPGGHHADAGQERAGVHRSEGVLHPNFTGVDDDGGRADEEQGADD